MYLGLAILSVFNQGYIGLYQFKSRTHKLNRSTSRRISVIYVKIINLRPIGHTYHNSIQIFFIRVLFLLVCFMVRVR